MPRLRSIAVGLLMAAALLAVAGLVARQTSVLDRYFIYFPERELTATPADLGIDFQDVSFAAEDGVRLHGWFVPGGQQVTLLWFHGNAGNIGDRVLILAALRRNLGVNILALDYRGYGRSEGRPSEEGLYLDGEAALAYLRSRSDVDGSKIVLFGQSLGSAVAVETAARHGALAVVLEAPFTSVRAMSERAFPVLPVWLLVRGRYDSLARIGDVKAPVLVMHGSRDEIVPFEMGRRVYEAAPGPKRLFVIEGANHNDAHLADDDPYFGALREFLASVGE